MQQDFSSYEIIVSDNSDEELSRETFEVVEEVNSEKVRYFRPDRILSMTENFEFSLKNASGEYVLFMGDDDGLVVNSLGYVDSLIQHYSPEIVKCPGVIYYWPKSGLRDDSVLCYPYVRPHLWLEGEDSLRQVAQFQINYYILPMIYYSFVKRELIDSIVEETGSLFGESISPDIYSGIVLAHYGERYMISSRPFTIAGLSASSNGAHSMKGSRSEISAQFIRKQNLREKFSNYSIPYLLESGFDNTVLFELLLFLEIHDIEDETYRIDYRQFLINKSGSSQIQGRSSLHHLDPEYMSSNRLSPFLKELNNELSESPHFLPDIGFFSNLLIKHTEFDLSLFDVSNVYDASILASEVAINHNGLHLLKLQNKGDVLKQRRRRELKKAIKDWVKQSRSLLVKLVRR